ncbi:MAG TPA: ABC transporter permease, partial [Verrucomicrobiae bacterium]
ALGLAVSCLSPTQRFALTAVPLLMIPQMILGGMLRPEADLSDRHPAPRVLSWLTIQRWGFEAALNLDTYGTGGIMVQACAPNTDSRYGALDWVQFHNGSLPECFFARKSRRLSLVLPTLALVAGSGVLLLAAHRALRRSLAKRESTQP